jgi:SAM-dependent methyltransferase
MPIHPLAEQFAAVVGEYERGRPEYPPAAVGAVAAELRLAPGSPVLDLAAGTGRLSSALLAAGLDVIAVEPVQALRERLAASIGPERVRDGLAEAIPLGDRSVQAVTVGDAFHWFDHRPALTEIGRVLRPGGGLAVLATVPDWSGASWAHDLGTLLAQSRPAHPHFDGPPWQESVRAAGGWAPPREIRVSVNRPAEPERIVDQIASMSWVAGMAEEQRSAFLSRARDLIATGTTPHEFPIHVVIGLTTLQGG